MSSVQVYLVTGGAPYPYTASTEVLVAGEEAWREAGPLPSPRYGLRVASLGTSLLATGGVQDIMPGESHESAPIYSMAGGYDGHDYLDSVLLFDLATLTWAQVSAPPQWPVSL